MNGGRNAILAVTAVVVIGAAFMVGRATGSPAAGGAPEPSLAVVASPSAVPAATAAPTLGPSAAPTPAPPTPTPAPPAVPAVAPRTPQWTQQGTLSGTSPGAASFTGRLPSAHHAVLLAITCAGSGTIDIGLATTEPVTDRQTSCSDAPTPDYLWEIALDGPAFTVSVRPEGVVAYAIRIQTAPLIIPSRIVTTGSHRWSERCGIHIATFTGGDLYDDCATDIDTSRTPVITATGGRVTASMAGWTIDKPTVRCGGLTKDDVPRFQAKASCTARVEALDANTVRITGLPTGHRWLVEVSFSATDAAGDRIDTGYFAWVRA